MISNNPLMNFARKAELSVKLPSNGHWYEDGMIEYTPNGEVEVYPMLPKDEIMLLNPDALLSGQANINLIKSCVPSIKEPEKLLYPDANVLFLAIQKATYGDDLNFEVKCPNCQDKVIELKDEEKISEAESKGELTIHPQEMKFSISEILQNITYLQNEYKIVLDNNLEIYLHPTLLKEKEKYSYLTFNQDKLMIMLKQYKYAEMNNDDYKKLSVDINECYLKMNDIGNNLITDSISYIKLPDDTMVNNRDMIYEFVINTPSSIITKIDKQVKEINDIGITESLLCECSCCHHTWEIPITGFNQSDFFGISS